MPEPMTITVTFVVSTYRNPWYIYIKYMLLIYQMNDIFVRITKYFFEKNELHEDELRLKIHMYTYWRNWSIDNMEIARSVRTSVHRNKHRQPENYSWKQQWKTFDKLWTWVLDKKHPSILLLWHIYMHYGLFEAYLLSKKGVLLTSFKQVENLIPIYMYM